MSHRRIPILSLGLLVLLVPVLVLIPSLRRIRGQQGCPNPRYLLERRRWNVGAAASGKAGLGSLAGIWRGCSRILAKPGFRRLEMRAATRQKSVARPSSWRENKGWYSVSPDLPGERPGGERWVRLPLVGIQQLGEPLDEAPDRTAGLIGVTSARIETPVSQVGLRRRFFEASSRSHSELFPSRRQVP